MSKNSSCPICGIDLGYLGKDLMKADKSLQSLLKRLFPEIPQDVDEIVKADEDEGK
jgi:hypothetical protein